MNWRNHHNTIGTVAQLDPELTFVSDPAEVRHVQENLGLGPDEDYDSMFVGIEDGEYTQVWGMPGIVPNLDKFVYCIMIGDRIYGG